VTGYFLITVAGIATMFSLHLLALCATKVKSPASFYRVTEVAFPKFTFLVDVSVVTLCFGFGVSYLIVIGGLMPDVMDQIGAPNFWHSREMWVIIGFVVVAPISCFRSLDALQGPSTVVVFFVVFIVALAMAFAWDPDLAVCGDDDDAGDDEDACVGETSLYKLDTATMRSMGVFVFAYSCQMVRAKPG
jgi:amino acid permease